MSEINSFEDSDKVPKRLLSKIGEEVYKTLPLMLSTVGFKPFDSIRVIIVNVSRYNLKNLKVSFSGCVGYDSFRTSPETWGTLLDKPEKGDSLDAVTIRYPKLQYDPIGGFKAASVTYYGHDTARCQPSVQAELENGEPAIGKRQRFQSYYAENTQTRNNTKKLLEVTTKILLAVVLIYFYFSIRGIKRRRTNS
ncbi:MAG: hypothetical protein IIC58_01575 [Proteobacteria bacterium]|nr:hypothetical protein [Pseudomonadota bacterium]